ncbi:SGNH/GDSL hydrolase family protein [Bifidobacterium longum]|uniref:SGNH/GDSL hydrolase family protein n=1 Tax=Bifidobacterium longum TaxID=216816 RepID=UPI001926ECC6|nr:SGNH/GDSL hydrolase family protein [Bifidobacterium longum]MBL3896550.1 SGNH/GDSL hydrolase family protein [Bifidobacterium longum subsp. suis]
MNDTDTVTVMPLAAAGSAAVWCGDQTAAGEGASDTAHRYSTLASGALGLDERNHAVSGAGWMVEGNTLDVQLDAGADAASGVAVGYVFLMAGLLDSFSNVASMQQAVADTIAHAAALFPGARIVVGCGPGCIPDGTDDTTVSDQSHVLTAIRLAADQAGALCITDMRAICGNDPSLRADGISPNDAGHVRLAQTIEAAVREDQGEPLDTPVTDLKRKYTSGGNSWTARQIQTRNRREAEKREANRPTGTELNQLTSKLDALTRAQGLQQVILQQQQELLKSQQGMLERQQQQLESQQDALAGQQEMLKSQQELLKGQQSSLEQVVAQQGSTVSSLQSLTQQLQSQQATLDTIQNQLLVTVGENFRRIFHRLNALDGLGE